MRFAMPAASIAFMLAGTASAQIVLETIHGAQPGEFLGWGSCLIRDVNSDGYDDIIVGSPLKDTPAGVDSGFLQVISGKDQTVLYSVDGPKADTWFGQVTNEAGDVNADGVADIISGAARDDNGTTTDTGSATVLSGVDGSQLFKFYGGTAFDALGVAVAGVGDIDHDGFDDVIGGAGLGDGASGVNCGVVWVRSGNGGGIIHTVNGDSGMDNMGVCDGVGDVNADGWTDFIVGARWDDDNGTDCGMARVYSGKDLTILHTWYGSNADDNLGNVVSRGGDINNDGFDDVLVGVWRADMTGVNSGAARAYSGQNGAQIYEWVGDSQLDGFGVFVDDAGDMNNDGFTDSVVGAFQDDLISNNVGSAWVFSGKTGAELFHAYGDASGDELGVIVHGRRDIDKNGFPDVISGAYWNDLFGNNTGLTRIFTMCSATVLEYGAGCAGSGGFVPHFGVHGCPMGNATIELTLEEAFGGTAGLFFLGLGEGQAPLGGGCSLLTVPLLTTSALAVPGSGAGQGSFVAPVTVPAISSAVTVTLQVAVIDPGALMGFTTSNGVKLTLLP